MTFKLIVDFEATCSKDQEDFPREDMEIIEIGAVIFDENWGERGRYQTFIQPAKHKQLTLFCKELTTIQQENVDSAEPFQVVIPAFQKWVDETVGRNDYKFYSWGGFDKNILKRQCSELKVQGITMIKYHSNIKEGFAKYHRVKPMGVGAALKHMRMKFEGTPHRALDDAINIARLAKTVTWV